MTRRAPTAVKRKRAAHCPVCGASYTSSHFCQMPWGYMPPERLLPEVPP